MEVRLIALEDRLIQTEEVLVAERRWDQPAGAGAGGERLLGLPSLVDTKAIGKLPTFSGVVDVNGQPEGMPWSQWSFVFRSYLGAFDPTATRLLRQVEPHVEDPVVVDNTSMTEVERRLSIQLFYVRWATGTFLGHTDESDEVIVGTAVGVEFARSFRRCTRDKQWQRDAFTTFISVPWDPRGLAVEAPMASSRRRYITKSLVQQHVETPGCSVCLGVSSQHTTTCRERFERLINPNATDVIPAIPSAVGDPSPAGDAASTEQRHATQPDTSKHVHRREVRRTIQCLRQQRELTHPVLRCPRSCRSQMLKWERCRYRCQCQKMRWKSMCCVKRLLFRPTWKHFSMHLVSSMITTLVKSWIMMRQLLESELSSQRCKSSESEKPPNEKVISTKMFHKAKGDEVWSRIVARDFADGVFAPE